MKEYALKAVDVLARRTRLAFIDSKAALEAAPRVIAIMGELLGWSKNRKRQELQEVCRHVSNLLLVLKIVHLVIQIGNEMVNIQRTTL